MMTTAPLSLTWATFGEVIEIRGIAVEPTFVLHRCQHETALQYHCATCGKRLFNAGQLEMHIEAGGVHHIATVCPRHGYEQGIAPKSFQLEILRSAEGAP